VGLALVVLGALLILRQLGLGFVDAVVWPIALLGVGVALTWDQVGSPALGDDARRVDVVRVVAGVVITVAGVALVLGANLPGRDVVVGLLAAVVVVGGLVLVFGPWIWRLARDLADERRERVRAAERAEMAAHLHDSVLQTLALVQRRSDDPVEVARLARRQERELREWLYGTPGRSGPHALRDAIDRAAAEVEDLHGVRVEAVVVGDRPVDDAIGALVAAAREAMVNAAKFSGEPRVSVFVEVGPDRVEAFVRDRGRGFDPARVDPDRRGIADSIRGRMERVGGSAEVVSAPGEGTEVGLWLSIDPT